ncbi:MAG: DUF4442 domain-containing protein [Bacteroidetes bacterium]|nr:DUF4442 domain-containing protein [Bacteroidota bacterium]MDA0889139.1 DUF4442 domain-containing protein [Bacteroidota bacterium]MDA1085130.1 DUF4442 domain-containing protein [Bacteroidota bacterium]
MKITPATINRYTLFKLPAAYFTGVRVRAINDDSCKVSVRLGWANKNPFRSMFWAVQGMAAELTTGVLLMRTLAQKNTKASMLVIETKATFSKKAVGTIVFNCAQGAIISKTIEEAHKEPQQVWLHAIGIDESGDEVCSFSFLWSIKMKN